MTGDPASPVHIAAHKSFQEEHVSHHPFTLSHSDTSDLIANLLPKNKGHSRKSFFVLPFLVLTEPLISRQNEVQR